MKPRVVLALSLLAALILIWLAWMPGGEPGRGLTPPEAAAVEVDPAAEKPTSPMEPGEAPAESRAAALPEDEAPHAEPPTPAIGDPSDEAGVTVRARFELPGGAPAPGVLVEAETYSSPFTIPAASPATLATAESDADGVALLRVERPDEGVFDLEATLAGHAPVRWRLDCREAGAEHDLGTTTLEAGGALRVLVRDADGRPAPGWWVTALDRRQPYVPPRTSVAVRCFVPPDDARAEVLLEDLAPRELSVMLQHVNVRSAASESVEIVAGETAELVLTPGEVDPTRRIAIQTRTARLIRVMPSWEAFTLTGAGIEPLRGRRAERDSSVVFDGLPDGTYVATLEDESFEPWTSGPLRPGTLAVAELVSSSGLILTVRDAASGERIEDCTAAVRAEPAPGERPPAMFADWVPLEDGGAAGAHEPPVVELRAGDWSLKVSAPGYTTEVVEVPGLAVGEKRQVVVTLRAGATIRGVVLERGAARPVGGAHVQLLFIGAPAQPTWERMHAYTRRRPGGPTPPPEPLATVQADDAGRFELSGVPAGRWSLHAIANSWLTGRVEPLVVEAGRELMVDLHLNDSARVSGRVAGPAGCSYEGLELELRPAGEAVVGYEGRPYAPIVVPLGSDGAFSFGPVPPGLAQLHLHLPASRSNVLTYGMRFPGGRTIELEAIELEPGEERVLDLEATDRWPGSIEAFVTDAAAPAAGMTVFAVTADDFLVSAAETDAEGRALLEHVPPGDYRVEVEPKSRHWCHTAPTPTRVKPDQQVRADVALELVEVDLEIVHADGSPARGAELGLKRMFGANSSTSTVETDDDGRLHLRLPPGEHLLAQGIHVRPPDEQPPDIPFEVDAAGARPSRIVVD